MNRGGGYGVCYNLHVGYRDAYRALLGRLQQQRVRGATSDDVEAAKAWGVLDAQVAFDV